MGIHLHVMPIVYSNTTGRTITSFPLRLPDSTTTVIGGGFYLLWMLHHFARLSVVGPTQNIIAVAIAQSLVDLLISFFGISVTILAEWNTKFESTLLHEIKILSDTR